MTPPGVSPFWVPATQHSVALRQETDVTVIPVPAKGSDVAHEAPPSLVESIS
ncbi:MAG: hypothetical protein ACRDY3_08545 [Acidimicrobiales bacterium]